MTHGCGRQNCGHGRQNCSRSRERGIMLRRLDYTPMIVMRNRHYPLVATPFPSCYIAHHSAPQHWYYLCAVPVDEIVIMTLYDL